jgi:hypothetical protein
MDGRVFCVKAKNPAILKTKPSAAISTRSTLRLALFIAKTKPSATISLGEGEKRAASRATLLAPSPTETAVASSRFC